MMAFAEKPKQSTQWSNRPSNKRVGHNHLILKTMKIVKVKKSMNKAAGCCDCFGGGCRCND